MSEHITYRYGHILEEGRDRNGKPVMVPGKRVHIIAIPDFGRARPLCTSNEKLSFRIDDELDAGAVDCKRCCAKTWVYKRLLYLEARAAQRKRVEEAMRG